MSRALQASERPLASGDEGMVRGTSLIRASPAKERSVWTIGGSVAFKHPCQKANISDVYSDVIQVIQMT